MKTKKAQASIEYIILFAFISVAMLLMAYWIYEYYQSYDEKLVSARVEDIARQIQTASEKIYYFGPPSQTTVQANMPSGVSSMEVHWTNPDDTPCTKCTELRFNLTQVDSPQIVTSTRIKLKPCGGEPNQRAAIFEEKYFTRGLKSFQIIATRDDHIEICLPED